MAFRHGWIIPVSTDITHRLEGAGISRRSRRKASGSASILFSYSSLLIDAAHFESAFDLLLGSHNFTSWTRHEPSQRGVPQVIVDFRRDSDGVQSTQQQYRLPQESVGSTVFTTNAKPEANSTFSSPIELYKFDLDSPTLTLVRDIEPGRDGSYPANMTAVMDSLYFTADTSDEG